MFLNSEYNYTLENEANELAYIYKFVCLMKWYITNTDMYKNHTNIHTEILVYMDPFHSRSSLIPGKISETLHNHKVIHIHTQLV